MILEQNHSWVAGLVALAALLAGAGFIAVRTLARRRPPRTNSYLRALESMAVGRANEAVKLLRQAVEEDTDNAGAYLHLGRLLRARGDFDRALRIHRELTIRELGREDRRRVLMEVLADLIQAGRWAEAKSVAKQLRAMGPADATLLRAMGKIHENLREWDEAWATFEELEKRRPTRSPRRLALYRAFIATDYEKRGKLKDAQRHYEAALALEPSLPGALLRLADVYLADGEPGKAVETWKELIRRNPNAMSTAFDRLEKAVLGKDPDRAAELIRLYEQILAESPQDNATRRALANLLRRRGQPEEALKVIDAALAQQPDDRRLRTERVRLLMETGAPDAAFAEIRDYLLAKGSGAAPAFTCKECGYRSEDYLWRCPSCQRWETFEE